MIQGVCNLNDSFFSISLSFLGSCICLRKSQYRMSSIRYFCPCLNCYICLHDNRGYMIIALLKYKYVLFYVLICADNHFFDLGLLPSSTLSSLAFFCFLLFAVGPCWCFTTDSLPRGYPGQFVRASAYAELDGERKRQSIYPGLDPRSWSSNSPTSSQY